MLVPTFFWINAKEKSIEFLERQIFADIKQIKKIR